jgi:hypothetical protein
MFSNVLRIVTAHTRQLCLLTITHTHETLLRPESTVCQMPRACA